MSAQSPLDCRFTPAGAFYEDLVWTPEGVKHVPGSGIPETTGLGRRFPDLPYFNKPR